MISTPLVSFVPATAAQPTDVLRRDNALREVVAPAKPNQAFQRERGLGSDSERRAQSQERGYAQQLAQARLEAGFPGFLRRVEFHQEPDRSDRDDSAPRQFAADTSVADTLKNSASTNLPEAYARAQLQHDQEPLPVRFLPNPSAAASTSEGGGVSLNYDWQRYAPSDGLNADMLERGRRIEMYYQSSFRANEQFLLGVA